MIRMLTVGCDLGTRFERRLCDEVHVNVACRWFYRLGRDGPVPDPEEAGKDHPGAAVEPGSIGRGHPARGRGPIPPLADLGHPRVVPTKSALGGLDLIGADLVEVAPPLDPSVVIAPAGATLVFEILCLPAQAVDTRRPCAVQAHPVPD